MSMGLTMLFSLILVNTYLEFRIKLNKINLFHPLFALGDMIRSLWVSTFGCFAWTHWIPGSQINGFLDHNLLDCWITMGIFWMDSVMCWVWLLICPTIWDLDLPAG